MTSANAPKIKPSKAHAFCATITVFHERIEKHAHALHLRALLTLTHASCADITVVLEVRPCNNNSVETNVSFQCHSQGLGSILTRHFGLYSQRVRPGLMLDQLEGDFPFVQK